MLARRSHEATAYWERGEMAYALTGSGDGGMVMRSAQLIAEG